MADLKEAKTDPKKQLWDEIDDVRAVMLGVPSTGQHMRPMAALASREENRIWFFTKKNSDLVKAAGAGKAHMCLVSEDQDYHACVSGTLAENKSQQHVDRFWSPVVSAWFHGKDDPELTMLELIPDHAAVWASSDSSMRFGWEIAKANMSDTEPDVGIHTEFSM